MGLPPLTDKERRIYDFISSYFDEFERPPTYAEIREQFGYKHNSSVQDFINQLRAKGYIKAPIGSNRKRAIELVTRKHISDVELVPLEGVVAAGRLTEAVHNRDYIEVPRTLLKSGVDYFALKVKGDSMVDECIRDGDWVVIRRQSIAHNGQTVVALVDQSEATIKKYYKRKEHIELVPANPNYATIKVKQSSDFKILGVLSNVIRRFC